LVISDIIKTSVYFNNAKQKLIMYGKLLNQFSADTGVSQKDVAERLKYSSQRVNNYFRDKADPPFEFLEMFRTEFSIDLRKLADKESKRKEPGTKSFNPIPVFDLDLKTVADLNFFNHSELIQFYIEAPFYSDCFAGVRVSTSVMSPALDPSDIAIVKQIQNFETIPFGEPFLIITEEQRLIRYIRKSDDPKKFILKAELPTADDMDVQKTDILFLFQIKGRMCKR
jgi:transcriptional regulator with XRE-family HTH domain